MMSQVSSTAVDDTPAEPVDAAEWSFGALCSDAPTTIPTVTPSAITAATGMAIRAARLFLPRRRRADRRPLSNSAHLHWSTLECSPAHTVDQRRCPDRQLRKIRFLSVFKRRARQIRGNSLRSSYVAGYGPESGPGSPRDQASPPRPGAPAARCGRKVFITILSVAQCSYGAVTGQAPVCRPPSGPWSAVPGSGPFFGRTERGARHPAPLPPTSRHPPLVPGSPPESPPRRTSPQQARRRGTATRARDDGVVDASHRDHLSPECVPS
jgi:hypothetical protein